MIGYITFSQAPFGGLVFLRETSAARGGASQEVVSMINLFIQSA